jgi:hypothetical protein
VAVRELDFSEIMICSLLINVHINFAKTAILLFSDRLLVTSAPSGQASQAPGIRLSHRLHSETRTAFAQSKSDFGVSAMANMWAWRAATEIQLVT